MASREDEDAVVFNISEDLISSPYHKSAGTSTINFDGLLRTPLRLHEDLTQGCGGQLWPAGMVLAKYLLREPQQNLLRSKLILELGAGGGLVGLALALALKIESSSMIQVTDQAPMLQLMRRNISLNELPSSLIEASILDWGSTFHAQNQPDILLAADCVYFEPAFPLLLQTMSQLIGPKTVCYFCFKKRRRADLRFIKVAKKNFKIEDILDDPDREKWTREGLFLYKITSRRP